MKTKRGKIIERCEAVPIAAHDYIGTTCNVYACGGEADTAINVGGGSDNGVSTTSIWLCGAHARKMAISLVRRVCRVKP